ncbi:MAG TPA: SDR family oxidoreductase [Candidatus Saccharimonadia bacterium]|jgi:pteridine reductase
MKQIALVTGAARNIGKGIARTLLERGYSCVLVDRDAAELQRAFEELSRVGECHQYVADLMVAPQLEQLATWTHQQKLPVTALINNAAYDSPAPATSLTVTELDRSFAVNLRGPFYLTSLFTQHWLEHNVRGSVIFISSTHAHVIRTHPLYSASKAAIQMFVKEAALELAASHIRVNAVAPGSVVDTPDLNPATTVPAGFDQQPRDVGEAVAFLLSDQARFITGQTLTVDGGFSLAHTHYWKNQGKL